MVFGNPPGPFHTGDRGFTCHGARLKPEYLANKISKIVKARKPRYNYIISTLEQRLSVLLKAILPPSWFAAILRSYYKL